jgi:hypothetical protein
MQTGEYRTCEPVLGNGSSTVKVMWRLGFWWLIQPVFELFNEPTNDYLALY